MRSIKADDDAKQLSREGRKGKRHISPALLSADRTSKCIGTVAQG